MPGNDYSPEPDSHASPSSAAPGAVGGGCGGSCDACRTGGGSGLADEPSGPHRGWRLVLLAALYFLFPVACAVAGASVYRKNPDVQAGVAVLGLVGGMAVAAGLARIFSRRKAKETVDG